MSERLEIGFVPPYTAMAVERDGEITGGVLFNCFESFDVHVTAAGEGWTRAFLQAVGGYVYTVLGCERMTFVTEQQEVADLAIRLGGQIEGKLRSHFGPGRDGILIGVLREEWRYSDASTSAKKAIACL